jgi:putative sporulation protein YtxC
VSALAAVVMKTTSFRTALEEWLKRELVHLRHQGINVEVRSWQQGTDSYVSCRSETDNEATQEVFRYHIANAMTGVIQNQVETYWIRRMLRRQRNMTRADKEQLAAHVSASLQQAKADGEGLPRHRILLKLMIYLDLHHAIHLEGFFHFRLKDYQKQIEAAITESIQWLNVQRERQEFMDILRYYMITQEPQIEFVEVYLRKNGLFRLLDEGRGVIENDYLESFVSDVVEGQIDYGDLLMSTMITLAPAHIRCHYESPLPVIEIMKGVFAERITFCQGCSSCNFQHTMPPDSRQ